ncbi:putative methyltransferase, YaeB/AF_0241 family [Methanocella conradii HZ254]|uniref:Methyltransferase, YaeB/AF_0241 family n=1 Tax=Methanocella conradii (strain DSM 24694 / JCM 17849 / CGMCC 1.5162 / HZ254) TaxID=1041930 RepID=H8I506_METCZ|nr:tRNA (N6-threonylcarbamoyladenosine(37)-N6)-methyltransferase TrmO [Methanocella conradii]AFD01100.1 putative methyltransferase, YaeB/AF_0241 family [Methanocella conradii HZ254]MDI6897063.1 tRNA (N6-threonylcarbamoyladenosine(37)-N6)-methyltransferase TrmO [Methanocella conradii]
MQKIVLTPIGYVRNANKVDTPSQELQASTSEIIVEEKYADGLMGLEKNEMITVIFYFHLVDRYELKLHPRGDPSRPITGVFNTRSQFRPNPIGVTVVRLKSIEGNKLVVEGLDAVDGTPVLDIKPHVLTFDEGAKADDTGKDRA